MALITSVVKKYRRASKGLKSAESQYKFIRAWYSKLHRIL